MVEDVLRSGQSKSSSIDGNIKKVKEMVIENKLTILYYLGLKSRLRKYVRRKRLDLWKNISWILHHDNAISHTTFLVREFSTKNFMNVIDQTPCDILFPKLKLSLPGRTQHKKVILQNPSLLFLSFVRFFLFPQLLKIKKFQNRFSQTIKNERI